MSLADPEIDHVALPPGKPLVHPLAASAVVIYATLLLLGLAVPSGLVNWARDMEPGTRQQAVLAAAQAIERFSIWAGINRPYELARAAFLAATGKSED
jgi:hypothetical protein